MHHRVFLARAPLFVSLTVALLLLLPGCRKPSPPQSPQSPDNPPVAVVVDAVPLPTGPARSTEQAAATPAAAAVVPGPSAAPSPSAPAQPPPVVPAPEQRKSEPVLETAQPSVIVSAPAAGAASADASPSAQAQPDEPPPLVAIPAPKSQLTLEGRRLIYEFEVGGGQSYYNRFLIRPTWPGAASGVTIAIGYDVGYNSPAVIRSDWRELDAVSRLVKVAGVTGQSARARLAEVRDIIVRWDLAEKVYNSVTVAKFWSLCDRTYPGFEELRPNAQAALLSLTFNRGNSLIGERRREMREIARLAPKSDYPGMARQLRLMKRVWVGTDIEAGMFRRREAEARLIETP